MSDGARELLALLLSGLALYALLCLATFHTADLDQPIPVGGGRNLGGTFGYYLAGGFTYVLGYAAVVPFLALIGCAIALFLHRTVERVWLKSIGALMFAAMLSLLLADPHGPATSGAAIGYTAMTPQGPGGAFGANLSPRLFDVFGGPGRVLLLAFGGLVSLLVATEWLFSQLLTRTVATLRASFVRLFQRRPAMAGGPVEVEEEEQAPRRARGKSGATNAKSNAKAIVLDDDGEDADVDEDAEVVIPAARPKRSPTKSKAEATDDENDEDLDAAAEALWGLSDPDDDDIELPSKRGKKAKSDAGKAGSKADEHEDLAADLASAKAGAGKPEAGKSVADRGGSDRSAASTPEVPPEPVKIVVPIARPQIQKPKPKPKKVAQSDLPFDAAYPYPPVDLFREAEVGDVGETAEQLQKGGEAIASKLKSFGIDSQVVAASIGPAVTQYELRLADGIRVNKVAGYSDDLAAALKAFSVRVVAPIPGKDTIGIEVPNATRQKVFMRDLLDQFGRSEDLAVPLYLGKDVAGNPIVEDLARMPHLLIAGTTGSGKSVCINAILLSILMTRTPEQVKLILVDPKMVELQAYKQVPHLCCEVVTNMKKAPSVLQWAVDEMENRYTMLSAAGVNHIKNYNRLGQQELEKRLKREVEHDRIQLPYIVIVIDEFADLMNVAQNEVEESIQRLAQKSRAVGMHVILATQRPSSEVITGIIKANLPCQIAFKVNRKIDSRVILDSNGAEKLLGHGDMLYVPPGGGAMTRAQGAFVSDDEMQSVVKYLEEHGQRPDFLPDLVQTQSAQNKGMEHRDDLYRKAVEVILGQQRGSATLLQRALAVGYTRATRLLEMMEEDGLVGEFAGSKSREVLMTFDEYLAREAAVAEELANRDAAGDGDGDSDGDVAAAVTEVGEPSETGSESGDDREPLPPS
ncbi:MAG: DNA translocase FtsK [Planctomycetota bacterium]